MLPKILVVVTLICAFFTAETEAALTGVQKCRSYVAKVEMDYAKCLKKGVVLQEKGKSSDVSKCERKRDLGILKAEALYVAKQSVDSDACGLDEVSLSVSKALMLVAAGEDPADYGISAEVLAGTVLDATSDNAAVYATGFDEGVSSVDITTDNQAVCQSAAGVYDSTEDTCAVDITVDNEVARETGFAEGVASVDITVDNEAVCVAAGGLWSGDECFPADGVCLEEVSYTYVSTGHYHTCAIDDLGRLWCWGRNHHCQLGDYGGYPSQPIEVQGLGAAAVEVTQGINHTCALTADGAVLCWGLQSSGFLGNGSDAYANLCAPVPVVGLGGGVVKVEAGQSSTCALTDQGAVFCWGFNNAGQLGDGSGGQGEFSSVPVPVSDLVGTVVDIAVGHEHACALTNVGAVWCWGNNEYGQLGDGTTNRRLSAVPVLDIQSGAEAIALGDFHSCALTELDQVYCWGQYQAGSYEEENISPSLAPVLKLDSGHYVAELAPAAMHTCALTDFGEVLCWGFNGDRQLGTGRDYSFGWPGRSTPATVVGLSSGVIQIDGGRLHTCALTAAGRVACWGYNDYDQLGSALVYSSVDFQSDNQSVCEAAGGTWADDTCTAAPAMPRDCFREGACGLDGWNYGVYAGKDKVTSGCDATPSGDESYDMGTVLPQLPLPSFPVLVGNNHEICG